MLPCSLPRSVVRLLPPACPLAHGPSNSRLAVELSVRLSVRRFPSFPPICPPKSCPLAPYFAHCANHIPTSSNDPRPTWPL